MTEMRHFNRSRDKTTAQDEIVSALNMDGSRVIIHIERVKGAGHFLNVKDVHGEVWIFDPVQGIAVRATPVHFVGVGWDR